ncbi:Zinc finger and BTB domain-containing protein 7B [Chionoecetes opilio]|uniref:Zinc finger and BTB domain-containing protein 7B n=1 Tax=Chionoecetes opilio TaxID=41210 RepID=A0A8J4YAW5_CHIOP|nr:Zinc finger and BTB domain-containing protein 7B [Chionoecetes opilio]
MSFRTSPPVARARDSGGENGLCWWGDGQIPVSTRGTQRNATRAMASSSIEVLGVASGEVKVMLMDDSVGDDGEMDEELQTIITAQADDNGGMIASVEQAQMDPGDEDFGMDGDFTTLDSMEPPPGTIIFSPQDLLRPSKPTSRGRGRGTGLLRGFGASIKQEQSMAPPTYGPSGDLEVPVACEVCGKVMMTGKTLVQHMAIHSDLKPFQCPHCPKSFARKVHLQGHLVVHGIEKQFECPVCHQRFSRQDCVKRQGLVDHVTG